ncbi:hypothetical protein V498_10728 [Pseudogymnoascus sp. VKM F-4517 (FW-2822)]|nr:hypothetical protein V498_10728 [Pseudogymnoascus sp. VKM F-4517 (FW-2822)]
MFGFTAIVPFVLLAAVALGREDTSYDPDPKLNWRPENVTDLAYWLYAYTGSYYNGTTTFRLTPHDWGTESDEKVCTRFRDSPVTFSYDSLVNIVKPNGPKVNGYDDGTESYERRWNLTTTYLSETTYSFAGTSNKGVGEPFESFQWNMSRCMNATEAWWGGYLLRAGTANFDYDLLNITDPVISGQFNSESASFTIRGFFSVSSDYTDGDPSALVGEISIDFLGHLDAARSDPLVPRASEPKWLPTIGFSNSTIAVPTEDSESDSARMRPYGAGFCARNPNMEQRPQLILQHIIHIFPVLRRVDNAACGVGPWGLIHKWTAVVEEGKER